MRSEEYKEIVTVFYQTLKKPKDNTTKQTYELWRQKVGEHRSYINANKLANVRTDIMKKSRLTAAEIDQNENQATNEHRTKKTQKMPELGWKT